MHKLAPLKYFFLAFFLSPSFFTIAQSDNDALIKEIQTLMEGHYIFLEKAQETNAHLEKLQQEKYFDKYTTVETLAEALTEQLRVITKDKHLQVFPPQEQRQITDPMGTFRNNRNRRNRPMLDDVRFMDNNVGYFNMRFFGGKQHYKSIDAAMATLDKADALIIDLRQNGGGSASTVQYLCSYFFADSLLLNSFYARVNHQLNIKDHTRERWTVPINGKKRPNIPLFILISRRTFSAAEDFAYTMQSFKKAKIIGEPSRGGAHPIDFFPLPNGFRFKVPFAMSIDPNTKTNWEGTGVIPDIQVPAEELFETAKELATAAAKAQADSYFEPLENQLNQLVNTELTSTKEKSIFQQVEKLVQSEILNERDINTLGYYYLLNKQTDAGVVLFKANTNLYPNSANAFDSYAEGLVAAQKNELAVVQYQKAIELAKAQKHKNLAAFEQNFANFKKQLNKEKAND